MPRKKSVTRSQTFPYVIEEDEPFLKHAFKPAKIRRTRSVLSSCKSAASATSFFSETNSSFSYNDFDNTFAMANTTSFSSVLSLNSASSAALTLKHLDLNIEQDDILAEEKFEPESLKVEAAFCYSTPTREDLHDMLSSLDVSNYISKLKCLNTKLFCVDFDDTLLSIHTNSVWQNSAMELSKYIRPIFKSLVSELLKEKILIAIVTFSNQFELIKRFVNVSFPKAKLNKNIFIVSGVGKENNLVHNFGCLPPKTIKSFFCNTSFDKQKPKFNEKVKKLTILTETESDMGNSGKNSHLSLAMKFLKLQQTDLVFVDDDLTNIKLLQSSLPNVKSIWFQGFLGEISGEEHFLSDLMKL